MNHNHFPSAQQGDTNGVGEDEVAVTSGRHTHAERKKKPKEKRKLHPAEAHSDKDPEYTEPVDDA